MNYKDPVYILIILALGFFLWGQCESNRRKDLEHEQGKRLHKEQVAAKITEIRTLSDSISTLRKKSSERASKDSLALSQKNGQIRAMSKNLAILRIPVQVIADTLQPLRDYLVLADSLSAAKDSLIVDMGLRHSAQVVELNEIIEKQGRQIVKEREIAEMWRVSAESGQKNVRKLERGKRFRNVVIGVLTAGLVVISIRE
jgi:hypothetical protein